MAGVDEDSVRSYAEIHGAVCEAPCGDDDVDDNVVVRDAVRPGAWLGMPCVRADETNPGLGSDNSEVRVDTTPCVVDEVSPGGDSGATDISRIAAMNVAVRRISSSGSTAAPGPAFTPPTSTMAAPSATAWSTRRSAASSVKVAPRS